MINKQGLWFLTLFSIILVLSVYYIAMPNDTLSVLKEKNDDSISTFNMSEDDSLTALRVKNDEETQNIINELQTILLNEKTTLEEKNKAYDDIQNINSNKGKEQNIEKLIYDNFNYQSFVKINNDTISVTISKKEHDIKLANSIIRKIQEQYQNKMYITVKFQ